MCALQAVAGLGLCGPRRAYGLRSRPLSVAQRALDE